MVCLYDYTNFTGAKEILEYGYIFPSTKLKNNWDARYGDGVYLTSIGPGDGMFRIISNNYDGSYKRKQMKINEGVNRFFFKFNSDDLAGVRQVDKKNCKNRDIWLCPDRGQGQGISLDHIRFEFGETHDNSVDLNYNPHENINDPEDVVKLRVKN
jgi:hypothetical protein